MAQGKGRRENQTFVTFRSYYLFESHFCQRAAGWEKGGVEASVGFSRRNFLVPLPEVASFEDLNLHLLQACRHRMISAGSVGKPKRSPRCGNESAPSYAACRPSPTIVVPPQAPGSTATA